ncbi:permease-like cell division protein FtsX [Embleya sp. NPDC050493]|uniref:permease-like cell division protein FtsX n=1 Tax=Embleya sp. NPDC050493 TaxID=3363989 RepID=UPI00378E8118
MGKRSTSRTGGIAGRCAAVILSITTAAACSGGDGGKAHPQQPKAAPSAAAGSPGSAGPGSDGADEEAPSWDTDNLPPGVDFWAGKVDLAVFLCHTSDPKTGGCSNGAVTNTQRQEILDALKATPQVKHVYFEDRRQAWELFRAQNADKPLLLDAMTAEQLPESFRIKLKDPGTITTVASAFEGRPGVASTMKHTLSGPPTTPPVPATAVLTPERAGRAVLTVDDVGTGWTAGALTDTGPKPAAAPYSGVSGDAGCDRALAGAPTGPIVVLLGAQRTFENTAGTRVVATVQAYEGNGAALQLAMTRAMLSGCADLPVPWAGASARFRAVAAPTVGDETLGMRIVTNQSGTTRTVDSIFVRIGPNLATITLPADTGLDPTTSDRLARRAAEHLRQAGRD